MSEEIYSRLCAVFDFDIITKKISLVIKEEQFGEKDVYKIYLFKFCFLSDKDPVKFSKLDDLWFFNTFNEKEKNIILETIDLILRKIEGKKIESKNYINIVEKLINLNNDEIYIIFKYLQSIYSYYNMDLKFIIYPLLITFGFENKFIKNILRNDLKEIVGANLKNINKDDDEIVYNEINGQFIKDINLLLYYLSFSEKNILGNNNFSLLYKYLCIGKKNTKRPEELNTISSEEFNYFLEIKGLMSQDDNREKNTQKGINGNSTKSSSFSDTNGSNDQSKTEQEIQSNIDNNNNSNMIFNIQNKNEVPVNVQINTNLTTDSNNTENYVTKKEMNLFFFKYMFKFDKYKNLCSKIPLIINEINLNKQFIDDNYKLRLKISENELLIKKLSSTILLLQNSNIINLKRKLTEVMLFSIMENNKDLFSFSNDYSPNLSSLYELLNLIENKLNTCKNDNEKNKIKADKDIIKKLIEKEEVKLDSTINIKTNSKIGKQIEMIFDFLRFCKNNFHPFVHASKKEINYYLLPKSLFSSNIKCANYVFTLTDIMNNSKDDEEEKDNTINLKEEEKFQIYKEEKTLGIKDALNILFSNNKINLNEIGIDELKEKRKDCKIKVNVMDKNLDPFYKISSYLADKDYFTIKVAKDEETELTKKLKTFSDLFNEIIQDRLAREDAYKILKEIQDFIISETKEVERIQDGFENENIEKNFEILDSKMNRIYLILDFLQDQGKKIERERENIYKRYERYLNILITESNRYNKLIKESFSNCANLFKEWVKRDDILLKYDKQYLKYDVLCKNFEDVLTCVRIDINYCYDEKFVLWTIIKGYSDYLK